MLTGLLLSPIFITLGYFIGRKKSIGSRGGILLCLIGSFIGLIILLLLPTDKRDWEYDYEEEQKKEAMEAEHTTDNLQRPVAIKELKRWRYLLETGAISIDEFERKKKALLD